MKKNPMLVGHAHQGIYNGIKKRMIDNDSKVFKL